MESFQSIATKHLENTTKEYLIYIISSHSIYKTGFDDKSLSVLKYSLVSVNNIYSKYLWSTYYILQSIPWARNRTTEVNKIFSIKTLLIICYMLMIESCQSLEILRVTNTTICVGRTEQNLYISYSRPRKFVSEVMSIALTI